MPHKIRPIDTIEPEHPDHPQPFEERPPYEEDEINLVDYLIVLLRHKFLIIGMIFVAGIGAVVMTHGRQRTYRSEATIAPRTQETTKFYRPNLGGEGLSGNTAEQISIGGSGSRVKIVTELNSR